MRSSGCAFCDRGKSGWKWPLRCDRARIPVSSAADGTNRHDQALFAPTLAAAGRGLLEDGEFHRSVHGAGHDDRVQQKHRPMELTDAFSAWDVAGYLLLDAVVGNTDRHEENWAVIRRGDLRRLAPTFDHASSLGFLLDDTEREARLTTRDRGYTVEAWADRARCPFARRQRLLAAAIDALEMSSSHARGHWLERCSDADLLVEPIWLVPDHRMSSPARDFAERVVRRNHERLMAW